MAHYVSERFDRGIVHVGRAQRDRTKRRRLEGKVQSFILHLTPAPLVGGRGADVVELIVGQSPPAVAGKACGLAGKERESPFRGLRDRRLVAGNPAVEGSERGFQRALEGGDRRNDG